MKQMAQREPDSATPIGETALSVRSPRQDLNGRTPSAGKRRQGPLACSPEQNQSVNEQNAEAETVGWLGTEGLEVWTR
jgi:hypothetical protein